MTTPRRISVVGLGYVGLPVAVAFGRTARVVGFDVNPRRLEELRTGFDRTGEVATVDLRAADILYTDRTEDLATADARTWPQQADRRGSHRNQWHRHAMHENLPAA